ncbi:type IV pili methyl-accepting chemotaxis transducer N-terminal domain-containing protein [Pseudooceanicola nanhaiensis]|uniref:type IV pili methyl-accepting chemotaxis transducer N-terminal domain-containing protein n=1 Tax=Pseudooceanicola nanhaiensis TaxID=375761 RepID=UPI001CD72614|nr:type IV pili methyl-accepting chemotaxis transducer N-terminal domain-containing protein [Pseudooceanicola nanhaiensis]MCA0922886.1 type IV pili methyl-accepting chemotaxis transducer N-terminal domain-containing protein [Pseudooceanicola nanhaiensis]
MFCALALCLLAPVPLHAAEGSAAELAKYKINIAGRQRMLSQRIAKAVCLNRIGASAEMQAHQARTAIAEFDKVLVALRHGDAELKLEPEVNPEIAAQLDHVGTLWQAYRAAAEGLLAGDAGQVTAFVQGAGEVLVEMNKAVGQMDKAYGAGLIHPDLARAINVAGRQRMLSQKALKEYCFTELPGAPEARGDLTQTVSSFDGALHALIQGDPAQHILLPPTWELMAQLDGVGMIWARVKPELDRVAAGGVPERAELSRFLSDSEELLKEMNSAVWMYESL